MVWSDVTEKNDKNLNNDKDIDALSRTLPTTICGDKALGQIIFPLGFLKSGAFQKEQWFVLQPTFENINKYNVSGDIRIEVSHTLNSNKTHRFEINSNKNIFYYFYIIYNYLYILFLYYNNINYYYYYY